MLRVVPEPSWQPENVSDPVWPILVMLAATIGIPYFVLSSTGPLLQAWFVRSFPGRTPYRLYALSNIGSLLALVSYPFFFERQFDLGQQATFWSSGFWLYALLCGITAASLWVLFRHHDGTINDQDAACNGAARAATGRRNVARHRIGCRRDLRARASRESRIGGSGRCGCSAGVCLRHAAGDDQPCLHRRGRDADAVGRAARPLPRDVYHRLRSSALVSAARDGRADARGDLCRGARLFRRARSDQSLRLRLARPGIRWLTYPCFGSRQDVAAVQRQLPRQSGAQLRGHVRHLHALPRRARPAAARSALSHCVLPDDFGRRCARRPGGESYRAARLHDVSRMGPVAVWRQLVGFRDSCPCGGDVVCPSQTPDASQTQWRPALSTGLPLCSSAPSRVRPVGLSEALEHGRRLRSRNFFGTLTVRERDVDDPEQHDIILQHGTITHGLQFVAPERRRQPTTYYSKISGVGRTIDHYRSEGKKGLTIAAVGLGVGTLAAYGAMATRSRSTRSIRRSSKSPSRAAGLRTCPIAKSAVRCTTSGSATPG